MQNAFSYIKDNDGIDTESSYPYEARPTHQCRFNASKVGATDSVSCFLVHFRNNILYLLSIGLCGDSAIQ